MATQISKRPQRRATQSGHTIQHNREQNQEATIGFTKLQVLHPTKSPARERTNEQSHYFSAELDLRFGVVKRW